MSCISMLTRCLGCPGDWLDTAISAAIALKVGFTTATADVINTWSRQDNYILCTHMKMKTIVKHIQWKCISTVSHDKSSRNKESCGLNVSCMLYSFKIVFPTRQVLFTSAVAVVKPTFHAITAEIAVSSLDSLYSLYSRQATHPTHSAPPQP